ncbi:Proteophosphoglycan 5 [Rhodotorula toruloides]|uniref:Proteophosphoglycan 5 n=1 Tax=Rhodotorula toruloides TaxID=5286 RepID=A0A2T0AFK7_RHOTO|nr:Proteophosphoglycan 5 [Rhodotorula toruloides]
MGVRDLWPLIKAVGAIFAVGRYQSWREAGVLVAKVLRQSSTNLFLVDVSSVLGSLHATRLTRLLDQDRLGQRLAQEQKALVLESTEALADLVQGIRALCPAVQIHLVFDGMGRLAPKEGEIRTRDKSRLTILLDELLQRARHAASKGKRHTPSARRLLAAFGIVWDVEGGQMRVGSNLDKLSGYATICGLQRITAEDIDALATEASRYLVNSCTLVTAASDADWHIVAATRQAVSPSSSATPGDPGQTGILTASEHLAVLAALSLTAGAVATASNDGDIVTGSGSGHSTVHVRLQSRQVEVVDRRLFEQRLGLDAGGVAAANLSLTLGQDFVGSGVHQIGLETARAMPSSLAAWISPDWLRLASTSTTTSINEVWSTRSAHLARELRGSTPQVPWLAELRAFCGATPAPPLVERRAMSVKVWEELLQEQLRSSTPLAPPSAPHPPASSPASTPHPTPTTPATVASTTPSAAGPPAPLSQPLFAHASPSNPRRFFHNISLAPNLSPQKPHERVSEPPKVPKPAVQRPRHPLIQTRIYPHAPTLFEQFCGLTRPTSLESDGPPPKKKMRTWTKPLKGQTGDSPVKEKGGYPLRLSCPLRTRNLDLKTVFVDEGMQQLATFVRSTFGAVLPLYLSCLAKQMRLQRRLANPLSPGLLEMTANPRAFATVLERVALFSLGGGATRPAKYQLSEEETLFQDLGVRCLFGEADETGELDGTPDLQTRLLVQSWRDEPAEIRQLIISKRVLLSDYRAATYTSSLFAIPNPINTLLLSPPGRAILSDFSTSLAVNVWNRQQNLHNNFCRIVLSWLSKPFATLSTIQHVGRLILDGLPPGFCTILFEPTLHEKHAIAAVAAAIAQQPCLATRLANALVTVLAESTKFRTAEAPAASDLIPKLAALDDDLRSALASVGISAPILAASLGTIRRTLAGLMACGAAADVIDSYTQSKRLDSPLSLDDRHASLAILLGRGALSGAGSASTWTLEECLKVVYSRLQMEEAAAEGATARGRQGGSIAAGLEGEVAGVRSTSLAAVLELVADSLEVQGPVFDAKGMVMLPRYTPIAAPGLASLAYAAGTGDLDVPQLAAEFYEYLARLAERLSQRGVPVDVHQKIAVFFAEHEAFLRDIAQARVDLSRTAKDIYQLIKGSMTNFTPRQLMEALSSCQIAALAAVAPNVAAKTGQVRHGRLALGPLQVSVTIVRLDQAPHSIRTRLLGDAAQGASVQKLIEAAASDGKRAQALLAGLARLPDCERPASPAPAPNHTTRDDADRSACADALRSNIFSHLPPKVLGRKVLTTTPRSLAKPPIPQLPSVPSATWPSTLATIRQHLGLRPDGSGSPVKGAVLVSLDPGAKVVVDGQSEIIGEPGSVRVARARDAVFLTLQRKLRREREVELANMRARGAGEEELAMAGLRMREKEQRIFQSSEDQVAQQLVDWLVPPSSVARPVVLAVGDGVLGNYTGQRGAKVANPIIQRMIHVAENRPDIKLLVVAVPEAHTSLLCIRLACRQLFATKLLKFSLRKRRSSFPFQRLLHCPHDRLTAHRDDVGAANIGSNLVSLALFGVTALSKAFAEMFSFPWFS